MPSRHSLREESDPTARAPFSPSTPYPPNLVEVLFSEVELPLNGVLGSSPTREDALLYALSPHVLVPQSSG